MTYTNDSTLDMIALDDMINDYIYSRDIYTTNTIQTSKDLGTHIYTHLNQYVPEMVAHYSTDMIMQATCARESVRLAQATLSGEHTYQSFLQACLQYIYTYQTMPTFFA
jgi:hypothetical protein